MIKENTLYGQKVYGYNYKHILAQRFRGMYQRCYSTSYHAYERYGGRGISIHPIFRHFELYCSYIESLPNYNLKWEVDRTKNNNNYEPGNLRWIPKSANNQNTEISYKNTSGYKGVSPTRNNRWEVRIKVEEKKLYLGTYATAIEGALIYNKAALEHYGPQAKLNVFDQESI